MGSKDPFFFQLNIRVDESMLNYIDRVAISRFKGRRSEAVRWIIEKYRELGKEDIE